jgi:hypothetical protein
MTRICLGVMLLKDVFGVGVMGSKVSKFQGVSKFRVPPRLRYEATQLLSTSRRKSL